MTTYYRNANGVAYHRPAPDWVRTGKALCGRDLDKPGFIYNPDMQDTVVRMICKDCERKAQLD